jgi:porin
MGEPIENESRPRRTRLVQLVAAVGALAGFACAAAAEAPLLERQYLTGQWDGIRPALSAHGFRPYLTYTGVMWSNLAGGEQSGATANGYLDFGTDIDASELGAWDGLGMHADFHWWQGGRPTNKLIGSTPAMALSAWEAAATFRVYNLYIRQALADDRLIFKLGQIAVDTDFMVSRYGGIFMNGAFGDLPSQNLNIDAPVYPLAAPGVFVAAQPWPWVTCRFGAYTGDPGEDIAGNHGFDWKLGNNAGYALFSELAFTPETWDHPGTYFLGGIYDTGGHDQFGTGAERSSHYQLYLMIDQALLVDSTGDPIVGAFARVATSPQSKRNVVGIYADTGLAWFGPVASRPQDILAVAVSILRFTDDYERRVASSAPVGGGETVLELTYQVAIAPWLVLQPDAQFFFNPSVSRRDAQSLGAELVTIF